MDGIKEQITLKAYRPWRASVLEESIKEKSALKEQENSSLESNNKQSYLKDKKAIINDLKSKLGEQHAKEAPEDESQALNSSHEATSLDSAARKQSGINDDLMPELTKLFLKPSILKGDQGNTLKSNKINEANEVNETIKSIKSIESIKSIKSIESIENNIELDEKSKDCNELSIQEDGTKSNLSKNLSTITSNIKRIIKTKKEDVDILKSDLQSNDDSQLLIGGFFKPVIDTPTTSAQGKKINFLIKDLQRKEHEIQMLSNNLKTAQALEHAEQIELAKHKEELRRKALEGKMKEIIKETHKAGEQLLHSLDQIKIAEKAQKTEELLRREAEAEIQNLNEEAKQLKEDRKIFEENFNIADSNMKVLKEEIEKLKYLNKDISQIKVELNDELKVNKAKNEKISVELQETKEICAKKINLIKKFEAINAEEQKLRSLNETKISDLQSQLSRTQAKLQQETEQTLLSGNKVKELQARISDAEERTRQEVAQGLTKDKTIVKLQQELKEKQEHIINIKEKAKKAIENANNAVLELISGSSLE